MNYVAICCAAVARRPRLRSTGSMDDRPPSSAIAANPPEPARPYHHGDLRRALLDAAEGLVREGGVAAFSLRECARRADVAHSAPGHHFGDVSGLLTEVAARGFDRLTARLTAACGDAHPGDALARVASAYVAFALNDPAIFGLMFHSGRIDRSRPRLQQAGDLAFAELVSAVGATRQGVGDDTETLRFAWAAMHGIAMLLIDGPLKPAGGQRSGGDARLAEGTIRRIIHTVNTFDVSKQR